MTKICEGCKADIVYGHAAKNDREEKYLCDECLNTWMMEAGDPPAFFPVYQPGHC